jgi:hypothetical protein
MSDDDQDQGPDFEGTIKKVVGSHVAGRFSREPTTSLPGTQPRMRSSIPISMRC